LAPLMRQSNIAAFVLGRRCDSNRRAAAGLSEWSAPTPKGACASASCGQISSIRLEIADAGAAMAMGVAALHNRSQSVDNEPANK
jgi:hypothetical protein